MRNIFFAIALSVSSSAFSMVSDPTTSSERYSEDRASECSKDKDCVRAFEQKYVPRGEHGIFDYIVVGALVVGCIWFFGSNKK